MRYIHIPLGKGDPTPGIRLLITRSTELLNKYCRNKVVETKLAPKSFTFDFDFIESRRAIAKSIDRLNSLIKRAVLKRLPFLEHASTEALSSVGGQSMQGFISDGVECLNPEDKVPSPAKSIDRYVSYLNYLCRKHGVPGRVTTTLLITEIPSEMAKYRASSKLAAEENIDSSLAAVDFPNYHRFVRVTLELGVWGVANYSIVNEELLNQPSLPDAILASPNAWVFLRLPAYRDNHLSSEFRGSAANSGIHPATEKFVVTERIFMFIPQIVKTVGTLLRKTQYDYKAYSFRTIQQSDN